MYAPTLDRPTARADTDLLFIDEFDSWSIEDFAAFPTATTGTGSPDAGSATDA